MRAPAPEQIQYTVRRSARARRVRVNVHAHEGVEVVLPTRAPERAAGAAVSELRPWIERRLQEARRARASVRRAPGPFPISGSRSSSWPRRGARGCTATGRAC